MTLEERFREECTIVDGVGIIDAKQCVSITDEQMIKFAEWINSNYRHYFGDYWIDLQLSANTKQYTTEQLLAEYKRINNL